jgi:hypothetical protein
MARVEAESCAVIAMRRRVLGSPTRRSSKLVAYRAHYFPGLRERRCGGNSFPGQPNIRRTHLMRIVRLVRTFFQTNTSPQLRKEYRRP